MQLLENLIYTCERGQKGTIVAAFALTLHNSVAQYSHPQLSTQSHYDYNNIIATCACIIMQTHVYIQGTEVISCGVALYIVRSSNDINM